MTQNAGHGEEDFENIPPQGPTISGQAGNEVLLSLADLFQQFNLPHTLEPGWETRNPGYNWYQNAPRGVMLHHTATSSYGVKSAYPEPDGHRTDGRTICCLLIQPDGTVNFVSADPANYSSGLNEKALLDDFVLPGVRFHGPQSGDLGPEWYGNREWVNIEVVNEGNGAPIPEAQELMVVITSTLLAALLKRDATCVIAHADGRGTKQDPRWTGALSFPPYSVSGIQDAVQVLLDLDEIPEPPQGETMLFQIDNKYDLYEEVSWLLFEAAGGTVNVNLPAEEQIGHDPKLVTVADFNTLADLLGMTDTKRGNLLDDGLYSAGKEMAALRSIVYEPK